MTDDEIKNFFGQRKGERICGKINHHQIQRINIHLHDRAFRKNTSGWKHFFLLFLICFGPHFFQIDVSFSSNQLFAQQLEANHKSNSNEKRKKGKRKKHKIINTMIDIKKFVAGEFSIPPDKPNSRSIDDLLQDTVISNNDGFKQTVDPTRNTSPNKQRNPFKKKQPNSEMALTTNSLKKSI